MSSRSKLAAHLQEKGLDDVDFWLPKFAELGVQSNESLHYMEKDEKEYYQLEKSARYRVEKLALHAILLIDESDEVQKKKKVADKKAAEVLRLRQRKEEKEREFKDKLENDKKEQVTREKNALSELDEAWKVIQSLNDTKCDLKELAKLHKN